MIVVMIFIVFIILIHDINLHLYKGCYVISTNIVQTAGTNNLSSSSSSSSPTLSSSSISLPIQIIINDDSDDSINDHSNKNNYFNISYVNITIYYDEIHQDLVIFNFCKKYSLSITHHFHEVR